MFGFDVFTVKQGYPTLTSDDGFRSVKAQTNDWETQMVGRLVKTAKRKTRFDGHNSQPMQQLMNIAKH